MIGNRNLNDRNFRKLLRSMTEKQLVIPILVNGEFEIIDRQHRFEACKQLCYPVDYYIEKDYQIDDVKRANLISCNWNFDDYLNLNCRLRKPAYFEFEKMKADYKLKTAQLLDIISYLNDKDYSKIKMLFEDDSFEIDNSMEIQRFLLSLNDFNFFRYYNSAKFTKAFLKLYIRSEYSHELMLKKIESQKHKFKKKQICNEYIGMLVNEIYSYGNSEGLRYDINNGTFYEAKFSKR
ncbi:ParB N-terminal domain-containing protein [Clostridium perfringens]|uniref:ParB N-terminal domain-containing protein n=1 Tax=Clostridium perfringens TaxID=1502 RepID=UPI0030CA4BA7